MTHQTRSRRSSPRTASPTPANSAGVAGLPAPGAADEEPSLGEVRFDEWFDTPVFESDRDERLEELAMSRRGPLRLAANALLRINARPARYSQPSARRREPENFYDAALWADDAAEPWWPADAETQAPADTAHPPASTGGPGASGSRPGLRPRVSSALDRWAEQEARVQCRLERLILPRRWQT